MPADLRALTEELAKALTEAPEQVQVEAREDGRGVQLDLTVAESDMGRIIGKSGRTARALRTIVYAAGARDEKRVSLDILE
ncbi:MAG TPA: KH domain-containing protein [Clostridia bacterium]|nr:KH domain-containing protein [Clostridia bacterium]